MTCFILILFLCINSVIHINNVSALFGENLMSDYLAPPVTFTYQVAVMGKYNGSNSSILVCGGGIIGERFILSAAQCFMRDNGELKGLRFSIVANKTNLKSEGGIEIAVDRIYLTGHGLHFVHDIAVAQLTENLGLVNNSHLSKLDIPEPFESFWSQIGYVAGHGYNWVYTDFSAEHRKVIRLAGRTDHILRYASVRIVNHYFCTYEHENIVSDWRLCAKMRTDEIGQLWGTCEYDTGSPLVIGKKVAGIVSTPHYHCVDSTIGGMYTRVSLYPIFINAILNGHPLNRTQVYQNRMHRLQDIYG